MTKKSLNLSKGLKPAKETKTTKNEGAKQISIFAILKYASGADYVYFFLGIIAALISGANMPLLNILFGQAVDLFVQFEVDRDNATNSGQPEEIINAIVSTFTREAYMIGAYTALVTLAFVIACFTYIHCFQMFALRQMGEIKKRYFRSILQQEVAWFDCQNSGEFASRISSDFKKFESGINENLGLLIYHVSTSVQNVIVGMILGWKLSVVIISLSPIIGISSYVMTRLQSRYLQRELQSYSVASSVAEEAISAIRTVFAFGGQQKERQRYERLLKPAMKNGCKRNFFTGIGTSMNWLTLYISVGLGIWYGVTLIIDPAEEYKLGNVITIFWSIIAAGTFIGNGTPFFESFQLGRAAAGSIYSVIDRSSLIDSSSQEGERLPDGFKTDIELRNVHFNYPTRPDVPILNGLNLKINSGEIVALVGSSGCGKSTIIQLIQRFYEPCSGEVLLDGVNLKSLNVGWLREQIGVVGQEPVLFDASIEENIRLGANLEQMKKVTQQDIIAASKEANAHDFISSLQDGYGTYVGDRGTQLSGGQKQRIAIARSLISKPKVLLLDEATSALDLQSEGVVQAALDRASKGRTTIIVAHRLSTIINADRIIFLDGGRVLEMGTHEELMKKKSAYYNLVLAQQITETEASSKQPSKTADILTRQKHHSSTIGSTGSSALLEDSDKYRKEDVEIIDAEVMKAQFPYRRIGQLIWNDKIYFCIALFGALLYGLVTPIYALIFGAFVDEFTIEQSNDQLLSHTVYYSILFVALAIGVFVCNTAQISLFGIVGEKLTMRLRMMAFSAMLKQEIAWFDEPANSAGALCSRLANDAANVQGATGLRIAMMCQAFSTLICCILVGFLFNWRLALGGLVMMPVVALSTMASSKLYSGQAKQDGQTAQTSSKVVIEVMNAVRTVVSLHKQQYFYDKFANTLNEHYVAIKKGIFCKAMVISVALSIPFFAYAVSFVFGGYLLSINYLKSGDFFRIIESMVFGAIVIGQTAILSSDFTKAKQAAINIFRLIDRKPVKVLTEGDAEISVEKAPTGRSEGSVAFRGVYFHYPSRPESSILNGLSFTAHQGETVALVGTSGCGKSTTIQLLEQFYDCIKGKIYLDRENIAKLNTNWVRSQMALVQQEPILFSYSIKDNIAYGDNSRDVPFDEIVKAAQMANVHDFVQKLPQGYDTPVGSKGTQLSGGQKQRLAIARALVRDPPILLLDEATSALDTASEKVVQEALDEASKGRTCLVIAHRLKTIVNAHKIVVLHQGQNVEEGTHEELLAKKGHYWRLYNSAVST